MQQIVHHRAYSRDAQNIVDLIEDGFSLGLINEQQREKLYGIVDGRRFSGEEKCVLNHVMLKLACEVGRREGELEAIRENLKKTGIAHPEQITQRAKG